MHATSEAGDYQTSIPTKVLTSKYLKLSMKSIRVEEMENDTNDFDLGTRKQNKCKSKAILGFSRVKKFTAKNARPRHGRVTGQS